MLGLIVRLSLCREFRKIHFKLFFDTFRSKLFSNMTELVPKILLNAISILKDYNYKFIVNSS